MKALIFILDTRRLPVFALTVSASLLVGAWIFQYGFGYAPCQMCYWQRHAHKVVIGLSLIALLKFQYLPTRLLSFMIILALLISFSVAFWHVGVEYKWWDGPKTCTGGAAGTVLSGQDLLDALGSNIKPPACSEAVWHFAGLSMAAWNALISLGAALLGLPALKKSP